MDFTPAEAIEAFCDGAARTGVFPVSAGIAARARPPANFEPRLRPGLFD
jgi:hypothetical protein